MDLSPEMAKTAKMSEKIMIMLIPYLMMFYLKFIYDDYLNFPDCAKIFFNCLKDIERQMNELYTLYEVRKTHRLKTKSNYHLWLNLLSSFCQIWYVRERMWWAERKDSETWRKKKEVEKRNMPLVESVDNLEQYSRPNCLNYGVKDSKDENADEVTIKTLGEEMNIDISHDKIIIKS